jgi:hypothetical protein
MNITNAQYVKERIADINDSVKVTADGQELSVPMDPNNRHYAEILRQVADGDLTIADAD